MLRSGTVCLVLAGLTVQLGGALPARWDAWRATTASDPAALDRALVLGAVAALTVVTGCATLLAGVALLQAFGSARAAGALDRCCPRTLRATVLVACGIVVAAGPPAYAGDSGATGGDHHPQRPLAGLPSLDRPHGAPEVIRVHRGDSLWRIEARRHPTASTGELTDRVDALYRANRGVIGADPDLILPGQRLRADDRIPTDAQPTPPRRRRG